MNSILLALALSTAVAVDWSQDDIPRLALAGASTRDFSQYPVTSPVAPPLVPISWSRVDSRGIRWTHADRAYLDRYVDGIELRYAASPPAFYYSAPPACVGGSCRR